MLTHLGRLLVRWMGAWSHGLSAQGTKGKVKRHEKYIILQTHLHHVHPKMKMMKMKIWQQWWWFEAILAEVMVVFPRWRRIVISSDGQSPAIVHYRPTTSLQYCPLSLCYNTFHYLPSIIIHHHVPLYCIVAFCSSVYFPVKSNVVAQNSLFWKIHSSPLFKWRHLSELQSSMQRSVLWHCTQFCFWRRSALRFEMTVPCTVQQLVRCIYCIVSAVHSAVSHYLRYPDRRGDKKDKIKPQSGQPSLTGPLSKRLQLWPDYSTMWSERVGRVQCGCNKGCK